MVSVKPPYRGVDPNYENNTNNLINWELVSVASAGNSSDNAFKFVPAGFQGMITAVGVVDSVGNCGGNLPIKELNDPPTSNIK